MPILRYVDTAEYRMQSCPVCSGTVSITSLPGHLTWHENHGEHPAEPEPDVLIVPGEPGSITGINAHDLATIGDLNDLGLALGDPWPTGSYIEYGDTHKKAHWDGTRFRTGVAV